MTGQTISHYEILAKLGEGGMGVVYKARDTRLDRFVAVKVLPEDKLAGRQARERFEREAKAVSSLNHPNICTLHDVGREGETDYLVMELVEGEELRGPLPLNKALEHAIQIADALDHAHRKGVVHRDLKPGNIFATKMGVKVLDFGLAKLSRERERADSDETLTEALTGEGAVLGTPQYMSPEQIEGKKADPRSDIFSFGAVLYEMLTGKRAFDGKSPASVMAKVMAGEPEPLAQLQPLTPPALERVVGKCLRKEPEERWQSARDLRDELEWVAGGQETIEQVKSRSTGRERMAWGLVVVLLLALATALLSGMFWQRESAQADPPAAQLRVELPEGITSASRIALSPDGSHLAIRPTGQEKHPLWVHDLRRNSARVVATTDLQGPPFWSPDGRFVGYASEGRLTKLDLNRTIAETICTLPGLTLRGASWNADGTILFGIEDPAEPGIYRVPAAGGEPTRWTESADSDSKRNHDYWPHFLPDGRHFVFWRRKDQTVRVSSLDSDRSSVLFQASAGTEYVPPGFLVYVRDDILYVRRFDATAMRLDDEPIPIADQVWSASAAGRLAFTSSKNGVLAFVGQHRSRLVWMDRDGREIGSVGDADQYPFFPGLCDVRISPDGEQVAAVPTRRGGVWILTAGRGASKPLAPKGESGGSQRSPVWSPEGGSIAIRGDQFLYLQDLGGDSGLKPLGVPGWPNDWSPDGQYLLIDHGKDLWILPLSGDPKPVALMKTPFREDLGRFSPDGNWIAYASDASGQREVYLRRFEHVDGKPTWRGRAAGISTGGG
ncbi:MAG: protein kinase, partial [bacterium]|nr:protein kinase [bacterium]